jgi:hypothetical protein
MKTLRNVYFWLVLGTIAFVGISDCASTNHVTRANKETAVDADGDPRTDTHLPPFWAGFITAVIVGGFWFCIYHQMNPPGPKE